jgi:ABC-type lipoprotein release transport system permease subunit
VNHLLPTIVRKLRWDEQDMTVVLMGTRGEVPVLHKDPKKPMLDAVPRGKLIAGYHVHRTRNLKVGDRVTLLGKEFEVLRLNEERGSVDDTTVWVHLTDAQEMLGMQNLINGIWALECHCTGDRISQVRAEISSILPGTQVTERGTQALARAEARTTAKVAAEQALEREAESREQIRGQQERFAAVLVPLIVTACAVWVGFLTYGNVRQRREEIGILRAIGLRSSQVLALFLSKAVLVGLAGAVAGYLIGFVVGLSWSDLAVQRGEALRLFSPGWLLTAIGVALVLSCLASWLPAVAASRQDPAVVFQQE